MDEIGRSEQNLVLATLEGDLTAFECLVVRHQEGVKAVVRSFLHDSHEVEDVTQEAFIRAFRKLSTLRPPCHFGPWVRQIARNMARNLCMRRQKMLPLTAPENVVQSPWDSIGEAEEFAKRINQVITALSMLTPPLRETARLAYLSGCSQQEIRQRLHIPAGTVKRRLWEARRNIRKEVMSMSRKGKGRSTFTTVPAIHIEELTGVSMRVPVRGYGSYFGSILEVGDVEVSRFFDYPGGVLTLTVRSEVMRKVSLLGYDCFQVLIMHSDCEPREPNVLDYFQVREDGVRWILRITGDEIYPKLEPKLTEGTAPAYYDTHEGQSSYIAHVVRLKVGDKDRGQCLAVLEGWQGGTPCERFHTAEGRQVLHRRYVGPDAPHSPNYDYENLSAEPNVVIGDKEYRLWYDTVLMEPS